SKVNKSSSCLNQGNIGVIVFGSDQGLVGQFNDLLVTFVESELAKHPGNKIFWPVGERMQGRLNENKVVAGPSFGLPNSIASITQLISQLLIEIDTQWELSNIKQVYLFFNHPTSKVSYQPVYQRLLPLDHQWQKEFVNKLWPSSCLPQLPNSDNGSLRALIHEYLFVSVYRACAESLASENASRLVAMQRAEKNIEELQEELHRRYHHQRQSGIDEELFDLVGGFEALNKACFI
ncbi:MAG: F-type H+-transporting ATPase subunit gamma, partial [Paraglaciecola sp.]